MTHQIFLHLSKFAFVACNVCNVTFIACNKCNIAYIAYIAYITYIAYVAYIACKKNLMSTTVWVLENTPEKRSGTESFPKVFLHNNCEQIYFILLFYLSLIKKEMRSGTHLTQQNMFLPAFTNFRP
jgi:hypothetical protein